MFKRHEIKRLAATALASLVVVGVLAAGAALAAEAPKPAGAAVVEQPKAPEPAAKNTAKLTPIMTPYEERRIKDGPWAEDANWLSFSAGYARAGGANAGDALGGYGVGFQHMINTKWSFGAQIRHEMLGHLGSSYEISVPFTAEFTRHYKWKTAIRPYTGFGGGYYFHKYYRTDSDDTGAPGAGWHLSFGANLPINDRHVLGFDTRVAFVSGRGENVVNPVFGPESSTMTQWSMKVVWALVP